MDGSGYGKAISDMITGLIILGIAGGFVVGLIVAVVVWLFIG